MVLGLIFSYKFSLAEVLRSFSILLEPVAILPKLFLPTEEAETITTQFSAALGAYKAFCVPHWRYRYAGHCHRRVVLTVTIRSIVYHGWHADDAVGTAFVTSPVQADLGRGLK